MQNEGQDWLPVPRAGRRRVPEGRAMKRDLEGRSILHVRLKYEPSEFKAYFVLITLVTENPSNPAEDFFYINIQAAKVSVSNDFRCAGGKNSGRNP